MSKTTQQFVLLLLGQSVCVAVGLWFHDSQVVTSIQAQAEQQLWADLAADSAAWMAEGGATQAGERLDLDAARRLLADHRPSDGDVFLVSPGWEPLAAGAAGDGAATINHDAPITWHSVAEAGPSDGPVIRRRFDNAGDEQLAVARPLRNDAGYLVFSRPAAEARESGQTLTSGLRPLSLITLAWTCALLGVLAYLVVARFHDAAHRQRLQATTEALKQTQRLVRTRDSIIFALAKLADSRDPETGDHLERITSYATTLAAAAGQHPTFAAQIAPAFVRLIGLSAVLHDIGKVGIADAVLRKRGPLTPTERTEMQRHTLVAGDCLKEIAERVGDSSYLQMAYAIAVAHHERWDGTGYPHGLRGAQIPLAARVVAIADVYDALSTHRVYKEPLAHAECVEQIVRAAGTQFDPDLVTVFRKVHGELARIAARWGAREAVSSTGGARTGPASPAAATRAPVTTTPMAPA